jgi:hypothetical protein
MASDILKSGLSSSTTAAAHDTDDLADEASDSDQQGDQDCENNGRNDSDDDGDLYIDTVSPSRSSQDRYWTIQK